MSLIKAALASAITAMNTAGKGLVKDYVPVPVPEVPVVIVPRLEYPQPEVSSLPEPEVTVEETPTEAVSVEEPIEPAEVQTISDPEPLEFAEPEPDSGVIIADEVVEAEPSPVITKHALRALHVLKASGPQTPIQAALTGFQTALNTFEANFTYAVANTKVQEAGLADNALALSNLTNAQQITAMEADLDAHAATNGASHALTPTQAGTYSQSYVDTQLANRPALAGFPLSRYGQLSYLPVGVSGSFQGASTNFESRFYAMIVEDDGTLVVLRNGTNGSVQGVYYAYSQNILAAGSGSGVISPMIRTNKTYAPSYFPNGYTARYLVKSDDAVLVGRLQDSSGNLGDWFISLTYGTFDATKHIGCLVSAANMPTMIRPGGSGPSSYTEVIFGNNALYFIVGPDCETPSTPHEFAIYTLPLSSLQAGGYQVPTAITGFTSQGFYGGYSGTNIRLAPTTTSSNASDQPLVYNSLPSGTVMAADEWNNGFNCYSAQDPATGNIRTLVYGATYVNKADIGQVVEFALSYSFTWSPTAKTAQLDSGYTSAGTIGGAAGASATATGSIFQFATQFAKVQPVIVNTGNSRYYHPAGWWMGLGDQSQPDYTIGYGRGKLASVPASKYAALQVSTYPIVQNDISNYVPSYGSAVGGVILGSVPLPNNWLLLYCTGKNKAGSSPSGLVLAQLGGAYTYGSLQYGSLSGYAPTTNRTFLTDLGLNPDLYAGIVSEITASGTVTCSAGQLAEGFTTSGYTSVDQALNGSGSVSITQAIYNAIRSAAVSTLGITIGTLGSYVTLIIPQNPSIPLFATLTWLDGSNNEWMVMAEITIQSGSRTGAINSISVASFSSPVQNTQNGGVCSGFTLNDVTFQQTGGVTIYETADCWLVGGAGKHMVNRPGWNGSFNFRFAVPKSTNRPDWTHLGINWSWEAFATQFFTAVPGVGFGFTNQNQATSDVLTKLLFVPVATNLATYNSWSASGQSSWKVLISQDVAQGWIIYFTDIQPCILNGAYFSLQPTTIDLTKIQSNPANTTFYVYIVVTNGVAAYVIQTTDQAESPSVMFIGTIVTNATQISSISMVKVTRIGNYRVSATAAGSAIPVSNGTPDTANSLAWK